MASKLTNLIYQDLMPADPLMLCLDVETNYNKLVDEVGNPLADKFLEEWILKKPNKDKIFYSFSSYRLKILGENEYYPTVIKNFNTLLAALFISGCFKILKIILKRLVIDKKDSTLLMKPVQFDISFRDEDGDVDVLKYTGTYLNLLFKLYWVYGEMTDEFYQIITIFDDQNIVRKGLIDRQRDIYFNDSISALSPKEVKNLLKEARNRSISVFDSIAREYIRENIEIIIGVIKALEDRGYSGQDIDIVFKEYGLEGFLEVIPLIDKKKMKNILIYINKANGGNYFKEAYETGGETLKAFIEPIWDIKTNVPMIDVVCNK